MDEEFKTGEVVEVWDTESQPPVKKIFLAVLPKQFIYRYAAILSDYEKSFITGADIWWVKAWRHCRKVRPNLKIDDPVLVKGNLHGRWEKRHFAGWSPTGRMMTWADGKTSWSSNEKFVWSYYAIPTKEERETPCSE